MYGHVGGKGTPFWVLISFGLFRFPCRDSEKYYSSCRRPFMMPLLSDTTLDLLHPLTFLRLFALTATPWVNIQKSKSRFCLPRQVHPLQPGSTPAVTFPITHLSPTSPLSMEPSQTAKRSIPINQAYRYVLVNSAETFRKNDKCDVSANYDSVPSVSLRWYSVGGKQRLRLHE